MQSINEALRAGHAPPPVHRRAAGARVLVAGACGALGSAVVEALLAQRGFAQVSVLVTRAINTALPGLNAVHWSGDTQAPEVAVAADRTALVIFDRERHANGRELPFMRPDPAQLPVLAAWLKARGVCHVLIVLPHAPASLPNALKLGLANLDEHAVAALGFEHLVFMRSAQARPNLRSAQALQRVADWVLSQLLWMVPQRELPVRAQKVAQLAAHIAALLPISPAGTRVLAPEGIWEAAQTLDVAGWARDWLNGRERPASRVSTRRM